MVRSPINCNFPPAFEMRLDLNSIVGYFSTSKKLGLFRSLSRASTRVSTEPTSMVAETCDWVMSFSFKTALPDTFVKFPLTFEMPMCRTVNCAVECAGSIFQLEVCASAERLAKRVTAKITPIHLTVFSMTDSCPHIEFLETFQPILHRDRNFLGSQNRDISEM